MSSEDGIQNKELLKLLHFSASTTLSKGCSLCICIQSNWIMKTYFMYPSNVIRLCALNISDLSSKRRKNKHNASREGILLRLHFHKFLCNAFVFTKKSIKGITSKERWEMESVCVSERERTRTSAFWRITNASVIRTWSSVRAIIKNTSSLLSEWGWGRVLKEEKRWFTHWNAYKMTKYESVHDTDKLKMFKNDNNMHVVSLVFLPLGASPS